MLFLEAEGFDDGGFDGFSTDVALDDFALFVEQEDGGNAIDAVVVGGCFGGVNELGVGDAEVFDGFLVVGCQYRTGRPLTLLRRCVHDKSPHFHWDSNQAGD